MKAHMLPQCHSPPGRSWPLHYTSAFPLMYVSAELVAGLPFRTWQAVWSKASILFILSPQYLKWSNCSLVIDCTVWTQVYKNPIISVNANRNYYLTRLTWCLFVGSRQSKRDPPCSNCNTEWETAELAVQYSGLLLTVRWVGRPPTPISELLLRTLKVAEGLGQLWTQDRKCQSSPTSFPPRRMKTVSGQSPYGSKGAGLLGG